MVIGLILQRARVLPNQAGQVLNQYVIYVAVPAMILLHLPHLSVSAALLTPILTPWVMFIIAVGAVLLAARIWQWSRELTGAMLIVVPLGNTSFLGFPMVETFFGTEALPYAVIYDQAGSFMALALFTTVIASRYGATAPSGELPTKQQQIRKLVTFPPLLALIVALTLGQTQYPGVLQPLLENLAATLVPVVMIAVGLQLRLRVLREDLIPFTFALSVKLLVLPLLALVTFMFFGINHLAAQVSVFEAAMPPMITAGALAISAGLKPRLVAAIIGYGVLISLLTLPLIWWLTSQTLQSV